MSARAPRWIVALSMTLGAGHIAQYLLPFEECSIGSKGELPRKERIAMTAGATLAALIFGLGRLPLTSFTWRRQGSEHEAVLAADRINQVYFEIGDALASALRPVTTDTDRAPD